MELLGMCCYCDLYNTQDMNFFDTCHKTLSQPSGVSTVRLLRYPPIPPEQGA